jgi:tetratricopeptide (TPR) repeat protein
MDRDEHLHFRPKFLEFIALLEEQNDPSLYWGYDCMAFLDVDYHTEESFKWHEKAYFAALELNDEILIKRTQALTLWFLIDSGFPLKSELAQLVEFQEFPLLETLKKLLAYFEPEYSNVFVVFSLLMSLTVHCLTLKMYEEAIYYGKRGLNIAKEWHDLYWMSFAGDRLADIYLNMGRPDQAAFHLLDTLEWHLSIGQVWQTLGYLWSKPIRFDKLFGGVEKIVPIISMVYYHPESTPFYRQEVARVRPQYENEIGEEVFAAAWEKGRDLNFDSAVSQVCSILSQESSNLTPLEPAAPVNFGPQ